MNAEYGQRVEWILRDTGLTPVQLTRQYVLYKEQRAAFEAGHGSVEDMAAVVTPGVVAMLDLEDEMLADTVARQVVPERSPSWFSRGVVATGGFLREWGAAIILVTLGVAMMVTAVVAFPEVLTGPLMFLAGLGTFYAGALRALWQW